MKSGTVMGIVFGAGIAIAIAVLINKSSKDSKRAYVRARDNSSTWQVLVDHMTDAEIDVLYEFFTKYKGDVTTIPNNSPLASNILAITTKYNLDT